MPGRERIMKDTGLFLKLDTVAADSDPRNAVRKAVDVANRIDICIHVYINDVLVMAFPGDDPELLVREWQKQLERATDYRTAVLPKP
jgi:hypothetical protein